MPLAIRISRRFYLAETRTFELMLMVLATPGSESMRFTMALMVLATTGSKLMRFKVKNP